MLDEKLPENAGVVGAYFMEKLVALAERQPLIGDVRGKGLMLAIELVKDRKTKEGFAPADPFSNRLTHAARARGAIIRCNGGKVILSPPLTYTRAHVDESVAILDEAIKAAAKG